MMSAELLLISAKTTINTYILQVFVKKETRLNDIIYCQVITLIAKDFTEQFYKMAAEMSLIVHTSQLKLATSCIDMAF